MSAISNDFHIIAHGGLCNHLNSLLGGLCITEWYGKTNITIHWTRIPFFNLAFEDLFTSDCAKKFNIHNSTRFGNEHDQTTWLSNNEDLFAPFPEAAVYGHEPTNQKLFFKVREEHPRCLEPHKYGTIFYESNLPNFFIDLETQMEIFRQYFSFKKELVEIAAKFVIDNKISKRTLGVHFRGGDYADSTANFNAKSIEKIQAIKHRYDNIFVFSNNSKDVEELEKVVGPCLSKMDMQKVTKDPIEDHKIYSTKNNQGAFINLLILAQTDLQVYNIWSTFSMWGQLLSKPMGDYTAFFNTGFIKPYWRY